MPIDPSVAVDAELAPRTFRWTADNVLLYHLAIGAGSRTGDNVDAAALRYTLDDDALQVLPSFAVVAPTFFETDAPRLDLPGCDIDLQNVLHGSQGVQVHRPLPTAGSATLKIRITDVWDKGKAAVIVQEGNAYDDESGDLLWTVSSSMFVRGEGGFGGERGPSARVEVPDRPADATTSYTTTPQQALLYRLCGDRNPLHADPAFAKGAGFPAPILHGLCSYGIVLREVTDLVLGGDAAQVGAFSARFAGVVFPGETIAISTWDEGDHVAITASIASDHPERDGSPVLADCLLTRTTAG